MFKTKYPDEKIEEVCCLLDEKERGRKITLDAISEQTGIPKTTVNGVYNAMTRKDVAKNHYFYKKKFFYLEE